MYFKKILSTALAVSTLLSLSGCQFFSPIADTSVSEKAESISETSKQSPRTSSKETSATQLSEESTISSTLDSFYKNTLDSETFLSNPGKANSFVYKNPPAASIPCEDYQSYEQTVSYDGKMIYGMVYLPKGDTSGPFPTVVISHGIGSNYEGNSMCAKILASAGFAVYCFDFCGGSPISKSSGTMLDMSILTEHNDLNAVIAMMLEQSFVDKNHFFLLGSSQGGCVTALSANEWKDDICAVVYYYPAFNIPLNAQRLYPNQTTIPHNVTAFGFSVGKRYYEDARTVDIYAILRNFPKDVIMIHGNADSIVDISYSQMAYECFPSSELLELDNVEHNYEGDIEKTAAFLALQFLQRHLQD